MLCSICRGDHPETDSRALSILASTPRRLEKLLSSVGPREAVARPMRGKWSIKEIVSHLADTELVYGYRYRRTIAEPGASLGEFDQEIWAKELLYRRQPLDAMEGAFSALRKQNLILLKLVSKDVWSQHASHPEYGTISLREMVTHMATHDKTHLSQIERLAAVVDKRSKKRKTAKTAKKRSSRKAK